MNPDPPYVGINLHSFSVCCNDVLGVNPYQYTIRLWHLRGPIYSWEDMNSQPLSLTTQYTPEQNPRSISTQHQKTEFDTPILHSSTPHLHKLGQKTPWGLGQVDPTCAKQNKRYDSGVALQGLVGFACCFVRLPVRRLARLPTVTHVQTRAAVLQFAAL